MSPATLPVLVVLQVLAFRNGRRVLTTLATLEQVEAFEYDRDNPDWGHYKWCERNDKPLPMGRHYGATVIDLDPEPGSLWEQVVALGLQDYEDDDYEFIDMMNLARRDQEWLDAKADAEEAAVYGPLERAKPKARRRKPLPDHHHKRWGHGNSRELINRVGQFTHMREQHAA